MWFPATISLKIPLNRMPRQAAIAKLRVWVNKLYVWGEMLHWDSYQ